MDEVNNHPLEQQQLEQPPNVNFKKLLWLLIYVLLTLELSLFVANSKLAPLAIFDLLFIVLKLHCPISENERSGPAMKDKKQLRLLSLALCIIVLFQFLGNFFLGGLTGIITILITILPPKHTLVDGPLETRPLSTIEDKCIDYVSSTSRPQRDLEKGYQTPSPGPQQQIVGYSTPLQSNTHGPPYKPDTNRRSTQSARPNVIL